jgi:ribosome-associated protein
MEQTTQLVETITKGIQEKKGHRIVVADLSSIEGAICHYFIICQGNSPAQVEAITESIGEAANKELSEKPSRVAGLENAQWVAMDYGDVLVHVFLPDIREYYDLEHLWDDAELTEIPDLD